MAPYQYKPLRNVSQEIRLVHLLPGQFEDDIRFRIVHSPFPLPVTPPLKENSHPGLESLQSLVSPPWQIEETQSGDLILFNVVNGETHPLQAAAPPPENTLEYQPQYEALSYTWGGAEVSEFAQVEGGLDDSGKHLSAAVLGLRPNLASALRYLRHSDETRVLWIDAICINQEDVEERNEQVKRMTDVYTLAQRVVAWLGEASGDSKHAIETLNHVGQQLEVTKSGRVIAAPSATQPRLWRNDHAPSFDQQTWTALSNFVERTWFYRIWCWQEIKLGGQHAFLQCGADSIPWNDFWLAVLCLHNKDSTPSMQFRERCRHIVFLRHDAGSHSVSNILDISRSKGCENPRDKIYGLLGIMPTSFNSSIVVDYLRPVEAVYKEVFLAHLRTTKRLELLKHCDLASRQIGGPSWVPDWSKTEFRAPILSEQLSSGISRAWFLDTKQDVLEVVGKQYTIIKSIGEIASKMETETLLMVRDWFEHIPNTDTYVTGETMEAAFALTLCMNRTREKNPGNHFLSTPEWIRMLRKILGLTATSGDDAIYAERETANTIQKIRGRRFIRTESGHIGTAPAGARPGDSVCLILGTYAPMVLRQTPSGQFQVVGECYVHGLGDAVGILGPLPDDWRAIIRGDSFGRPMQLFASLRSYEEVADDPRLGALPQNWERAPYERLPDDPVMYERFRNLETGELVNYDPRLSPEALKARGVELQSFGLV